MRIQNMGIQSMRIQNMRVQNMRIRNMRIRNMRIRNMRIQKRAESGKEIRIIKGTGIWDFEIVFSFSAFWP